MRRKKGAFENPILPPYAPTFVGEAKPRQRGSPGSGTQPAAPYASVGACRPHGTQCLSQRQCDAMERRIRRAPRRLVWNATVTCRAGLGPEARCAAGSRLAVGHPKGLALTRSRTVRRSPKGCRPTLFWPATLTAEGDSPPSRQREGRGDGWPPAGLTVIVAFHTKRHRAPSQRRHPNGTPPSSIQIPLCVSKRLSGGPSKARRRR